ncbi:PIN domain-containing protein [Tianweitania populi]|uniref:Ribonuclease VapC n=1 Tax=Tianweitania populi TaxID=1607949 RepID=A0A8J3DP57_9HYPH|nr:PIN domain-containing protein [Tianweitania populi]GHD11517.1 ribonuclease VapC [Tianweitania populi]
MIRYMLDSNVLIDIARDEDERVARRFEEKALGEIGISVVVSGEVRHGMRKRPAARSNPKMTYLLGSLRTEQMGPDVGVLYGDIRDDLERRGISITPNDYWIAAHAMSNGAVLVTSDRRIHDAGITGLKLEDWRDELAGQG